MLCTTEAVQKCPSRPRSAAAPWKRAPIRAVRAFAAAWTVTPNGPGPSSAAATDEVVTASSTTTAPSSAGRRAPAKGVTRVRFIASHLAPSG